MFADLAEKIARPLPAVDGDKKTKFKTGTRALSRSLNASTPSSKKRLQNEKKNTKKSASLPVSTSTTLAFQAPTVSTRKRPINTVQHQTPKSAPKRNRYITPTAVAEGEDTTEDDCNCNEDTKDTNTIIPQTSYYNYQSTDFVGWRRISLVEKVTATVGEFYIMIIPAYKKEVGTTLLRIRENIKRLVKASSPEIFQDVNMSDIQSTFQNLLHSKGSIIKRNELEYWEFTVTVRKYPKRYDVSNPNFPESEMDGWIKQGEGITFSLVDFPVGYERTRKENLLLIKFHEELDTIQLWCAQFRGDDQPGVAFSGKKRVEENLADDLLKNLHAVDDDPIGLLQLRASLSQEQLRIAKAQNTAANKNNKVDFGSEMDAAKLSTFCFNVDRIYAEAFRYRKTHFHTHSRLLDVKCFDEIFVMIEVAFPVHLEMLKSIVFSRRNHQPHQQGCTNVRNKRRHMVNLFLSMCRKRNKNHLVHWAMVAALAPLSKRNGRSAVESSMQLKIALQKLDEIHDETEDERKTKIQKQPMLFSGHDNVDRYHPSPFANGPCRGVMHNAMNSNAIMVKEFTKPVGTILLHEETNQRYVIAKSELVNPWKCIAEAYKKDDVSKLPTLRVVFESGVPFGYRVLHMPGLDEMPSLTYIDQKIPIPLRMRIPADVSDLEMLLGSRKWNDSQKRTEIQYSVDEFQRHLRKIDRLKELLHYQGRSNDFNCNGTHVALMNDIVDKIGGAAINNIKTFEREMCRIFNENYGQQDVFLWNEMCPRKEMRKEQLLLAVIDVFEKVGLLDKQGTKSFKIGPNATCRTIFQVGDVLTDVKVHALEEGILQRKTQFGNEAEVKAIHDAYSQTKKTFGHLHENIHRLQAIYKVYYGGFIQPIQVMLSLKKVGKDPTKGSWSAHEQLCLKIHAALSMLRVDKFLSQRSTTGGGNASTDPSKVFLMMAEEYDEYCMKLETAKNEVARSFALFSKYMERWKRCRRAVRLGNSATLESEGNEWLALWSALGKKNYCISAIRRMELLYETLSPDALEYFRANIMLKMSDGDSYMAMDDFVEKQNLSTKNLPPEQDLAKCCKMTRHLQAENPEHGFQVGQLTS
eukprot:scaffold926_cov75-Skeletonema_dohrnii-CCMP3373.AAC.3